MKKTLWKCAAAFFAVGALLTSGLLGCSDTVTPEKEDYIVRLEKVENFKAKAYPGVTVLTWRPVLDAKGYEIYREAIGDNMAPEFKLLASVDGVYGGTKTDPTTSSYSDRIGLENDWRNGYKYRYYIKAVSGTNNTLRAAAVDKWTVIGSSDYTTVEVTAANPGYGADVVYKVPSNKNFAGFNYAGDLNSLVDPVMTVSEVRNNVRFVTFDAAPYLSYYVTVAPPEGIPGETFVFEDGLSSVNGDVSSVGNTSIQVPSWDGKAAVRLNAKERYSSDYYSAVENIVFQEIDVAEAAANIKWTPNFLAEWDNVANTVKLTWDAYTIDGEYQSDNVYSLYYYDDKTNEMNKPNYVFTAHEAITPVYNAVTHTWTVTVPYNAEHTSYALFAVKDGVNINADDNKYFAQTDVDDSLSWNGPLNAVRVENGENTAEVIVDGDNERFDPSVTKFKLFFPVIKNADGKPRADVEYKLYSYTDDENNLQEVDMEFEPYDALKECVITKDAIDYTALTKDTTYCVYAFWNGEVTGSASLLIRCRDVPDWIAPEFTVSLDDKDPAKNKAKWTGITVAGNAVEASYDLYVGVDKSVWTKIEQPDITKTYTIDKTYSYEAVFSVPSTVDTKAKVWLVTTYDEESKVSMNAQEIQWRKLKFAEPLEYTVVNKSDTVYDADFTFAVSYDDAWKQVKNPIVTVWKNDEETTEDVETEIMNDGVHFSFTVKDLKIDEYYTFRVQVQDGIYKTDLDDSNCQLNDVRVPKELENAWKLDAPVFINWSTLEDTGFIQGADTSQTTLYIEQNGDYTYKVSLLDVNNKVVRETLRSTTVEMKKDTVYTVGMPAGADVKLNKYSLPESLSGTYYYHITVTDKDGNYLRNGNVWWNDPLNDYSVTVDVK